MRIPQPGNGSGKFDVGVHDVGGWVRVIAGGTAQQGVLHLRAGVPMACRCGTAACRGTITGEDWRRKDLQRKYGDHFAWHLLRRIRAER